MSDNQSDDESGDAPDILDALNAVPMDQAIEALATVRETPVVAFGVCLARIGEALPALLDVLNRAATHGLRLERDRTLLFRAVHILGGARQAATCQPLLRFLRRPAEEVDAALGDTVTETLSRIVAGVFDGDAPALFAAIADRRIDESARWSLLTAAAFLTWDNRIDADAMHAFLRRFGMEKLAPPLDAAWIGWGEAVAMLGLADLAGDVERVWGDFPPGLTDLAFFKETLADAQADPADPGRFEARNAGYIEDVLQSLEWTLPFEDGDEPYHPDAVQQPYVNPLRNVGRNDLCPCGSGRKYKKCCGAAA